MSCGVVCRCYSDTVLLWQWHRPAAVAPIWPLGWELPYVTGAALKSKKKKSLMKYYVVINIFWTISKFMIQKSKQHSHTWRSISCPCPIFLLFADSVIYLIYPPLRSFHIKIQSASSLFLLQLYKCLLCGYTTVFF